MKHILVMNGPNLNLLGMREPGVYGTDTYEAVCDRIRDHAAARQMQVDFFQSNSEGALIDQLHAAGYLVDGSVINSKERMKTALEIGCDMVESDTPDQAIAWYRELTEETERHA